MSKDDEFKLGGILFMLSQGDDEPLQMPWQVSESDAAAGWSYFASLTDSSGGVNLETFQNQVKKIVKKVIKATGLEEQITMFGMMAIGTFVQSEDEANEKVARMKKIILDKMLEATPCFAKAVFRFFGELNVYPLFLPIAF